MGLYILDIFREEFGHNNIGLYRDDRLGCFEILSSAESEKVNKKFYKIFKQKGLSITVEGNLQITDFFDETFDLRTDKYYLYKKDNNQLLCINKQASHPPTITKQNNGWSAGEYLIYLVVRNSSIKLHLHIIMHLKFVASMEILNSCQHLHQEGTVTEKSYGSIHHITST